MKLCKDCKHMPRWELHIPWIHPHPRCMRRAVVAESPVTGRREIAPSLISFCDVQREHEHCCGRDAKYWEKR